MSATDYRSLRVWNESIELALAAYAVANRLPRSEQFGLASQLRRSAVSIPSNIAEGNYRLHPRDYLRCVSIARGSFAELHTQLELVRRLEYVTPLELERSLEVADHVGRMLTRLVLGLRRRIDS